MAHHIHCHIHVGDRPVMDGYAPGKNPASHQHHAYGTHVKINAPGIRGHGQSGHVINHPDKAAGRHFVQSPPSEAGNYGPFHAHQLRPTGKAPLKESGPVRMDPLEREMRRSGVKAGSREERNIRALLRR